MKSSAERPGTIHNHGWFYYLGLQQHSKLDPPTFICTYFCLLIICLAHNCWLHDLPHNTENFVSVWKDNCILASSHMFEFVLNTFIFVLQSFAVFISQYASIRSAEWPWTVTQKARYLYLGVQEQSKFPFVCQQTFMFVSFFPKKSTLPSSGSTHQLPQMKWKHTFTTPTVALRLNS